MEFDIASLHQFRNCRVPLVRSSVCARKLRGGARAPPGERPLLHRRCEVRPLLGHRRATPSGASSFLNGRVETTIYPHNPTRVRIHPEAEAALGVKTKKRNTNPKVCISKNCQAPPGNSREAETRESTKQRGEALENTIKIRFENISKVRRFFKRECSNSKSSNSNFD